MLFRRRHAAAVRRHEPVREKALTREILRRQDTTLLRDGRYLAPDLVQMHGRERVELRLELAQVTEEPGGAHVRRPGGEPGAHAPVALAMPARVKIGDSSQPGVRERRIDLEWPGLTDGGAGTVPRAFAQDEAQAGVDQGARVAGEPGALLEEERGAAVDRFQRAE